MKNPIPGIITGISESIDSNYKSFVKQFKPRYFVVVNMYHVIPGNPVKQQSFTEGFDKGELEQASKFFRKVVTKHGELGFPNTEIQLIKGKKTILDTKKFGPVDMVKTMNVKSA